MYAVQCTLLVHFKYQMQENKIIATQKNANRENMRHYLLKLGYQICGGCSYIYIVFKSGI